MPKLPYSIIITTILRVPLEMDTAPNLNQDRVEVNFRAKILIHRKLLHLRKENIQECKESKKSKKRIKAA